MQVTELDPRAWSDAELESAARGMYAAQNLERRLELRALQRASFMERARGWELQLGRAVEFPRDWPAAVALGLPCEDCMQLIMSKGEDGHLVTHVLVPGQHWSMFLTARCVR